MPTLLGTDGYGYSAYASAINSGFSSLSSQSGVSTVNLSGDDSSAALSLGQHRFRFYGTDYDSLYITTNGQIRFGDSGAPYSNSNLTASNPPALSVYWDDLYVLSDSQVLYKFTDTALTIEWYNIANYANTGGSRAAFQVVLGLNGGGSNGQVAFNYYDTDFGSSSLNSGSSATVGISSPAGYYQVLANSNSSLVSAGQSILFSTSQSPAIQSSANTAPTTANRSVRINEDATYTFSTSDFSFSDVDSGDTLKSVLITSAPAAGQLLYNGATFTIGSSGYAIAKADLGKLSFVPAANANGDGYTTFQFKVVDQCDAASSAATLTIDVTAVNDAPTTANRSVCINEDATYTFSTSDFSFSDVDSGDTLKTVLITSAPAAGQLLYNGATFTIGSSGYAIAKADLGKLSFVPAANANGDGYTTFQFKVVDQCDAASSAATLTIDVTAINDAPTSKNALNVLNQAYEAGVNQLGHSLSSVTATGAVGSLFAEIIDLDHDQLSIISLLVLDATGSASGREWVSVGTTETRTINGLYGALTLNSSGSYTYIVNDDYAGYLALAEGQTLVEHFRLRVSDGIADPVEQDFNIAINGRDEVARPGVNVVSVDNRVNRTEKRNGVLVTGSAPGASSVDVNWGTITKHLAVADGAWSTTFATTIDPTQSNPLLAQISEIPDDWQDTTIRVIAYDDQGHSSLVSDRHIEVDTIFPNMPWLDRVAGDNRINASEKQCGITLTGTAEAGATVNLNWNTNKKIAIANPDGAWLITIDASEIPNDNPSSRLLLTATDPAGNASLASQFRVGIDTVAPLPIVLSPITDDGVINIKERSLGISLSGQIEDGSSLLLTWGDNTFRPAVFPSGNWSQWITYQQLATLQSGAPIFATVIDQAGNSTTSVAAQPTFDLVAPSVPLVEPIGLVLNGRQAVNGVNKSSGIWISGKAGSAEPCNTISVSWGVREKSTLVTADGSWQLYFSSSEIPLDTSNSNVSIMATDAAGNSSASTIHSLLIDTKAPDSPQIKNVAVDDLITAGEAQSGVFVQGTADSGTTVTLSWGSLSRTITTTTSGTWSTNFSPNELSLLGQGLKPLIAFATDQAGNLSSNVSKSIQIATLAAPVPSLVTVAGDNRINQTEAKAGLTLTGLAEANSQITAVFGAKTFTASVDQTGTWSLRLRSSDLPVSDGSALLQLTALNASGLSSSVLTRVIQIDRSTPTLLSQAVYGDKLFLVFSEDLSPTSISAGSFSVFDNQSAMSISQARLSPNQANVVELSLGRRPSSTSSLSTNYNIPISTPSLSDSSGNAVISFARAAVTTYRSNTSVSSLSSGYSNLELLGFDAINAVGNSLANTILGNDASNLIDGGAGVDVLTGLGGNDLFRFSQLSDSLLGQHDRITDLQIGIDRIDGPSAVGLGRVRQVGAVSANNEVALQQVLTASAFAANGAAVFGFGSRTFLALNDSTAGFNATRDAIIEITGYTGNLNQLAIV